MSKASRDIATPSKENKLIDPHTKAIGDKDYAAFSSEAMERLRFQVDLAQSLLKNLLLINGGAILALLTVLGNSSIKHDDQGMFWAFVWFGFGMGADLLAYFAAFYSQLYFYQGSQGQAWNAQSLSHGLSPVHDEQAPSNKGNIALLGGITTAFLSVVAFVTGSFVALNSLL